MRIVNKTMEKMNPIQVIPYLHSLFAKRFNDICPFCSQYEDRRIPAHRQNDVCPQTGLTESEMWEG